MASNGANEGERKIRLGIAKDKIIIELNHGTGWVGFTKEQTLNLIRLLEELVEELEPLH